MFTLFTLFILSPTKIVDDPFESSIIYVTPVSPGKEDRQVVYTDSKSCGFLQVSSRSFASSKKRGSKEASSFLEFRLTSLYRRNCENPLKYVDVSQARFFGSIVADVDVKEITQNCAITICKAEFSVSVRMTSGMSAVDDKIAIKFGAPHRESIMVEVPMKAYLEHRSDVLR